MAEIFQLAVSEDLPAVLSLFSTLGIAKWQQLGYSYSLSVVHPLDHTDLQPLQVLTDQYLPNLRQL